MGEQVELFGTTWDDATTEKAAVAPAANRVSARQTAGAPAVHDSNNDDPIESPFKAEPLERVIQRWTELSASQSSSRIRVPVHVLRDEALQLADVVAAHLEQQDSPTGNLPGLLTAGAGSNISEDTASELRELQLALGAMHSRYLGLSGKLEDSAIDEAAAVLSSIKAALSFILEDGAHVAGAKSLERLRAAQENGGTMSARVQNLRNYVELCKHHKVALKQLGRAEAKLAKQGAQAAEALSIRIDESLRHRAERGQIGSVRNRMAAELWARQREVRRVVRYVYRDHPQILEAAQSKYERQQRRKQRRDRV